MRRAQAGQVRKAAIGVWRRLPEGELVEVDLQVLGRGAVTGACQPGPEVGDDPVRLRADRLPADEASPFVTGWC